jgi:hypothetical protein
VLHCREEGRVKNLNRQLHWIITWLEDVGTSPDLVQVLANFLLTRGTMLHNGQVLPTPPEFGNLLS